MAIPARSDKRLTVSSSQNSLEFDGVSITCAPVDHLAIGLLINKEKIDPVNPTTSENTSSIGKLRPALVRKRSTPSRDSTMLITAITAMLVAMNRKMRFMRFFSQITNGFQTTNGFYIGLAWRKFKSAVTRARLETENAMQADKALTCANHAKPAPHCRAKAARRPDRRGIRPAHENRNRAKRESRNARPAWRIHRIARPYGCR